MKRAAVARFAVPAAFLLAVTVGVLLVRSALDTGDTQSRPGRTVPLSQTPVVTVPVTTPSPPAPAPRRFYVIASGDTLESIAARFGTTVDALLGLNPGVEPTALTPGQRLRIR